MKYRQHQLDNGLIILAECNPRAYMTAFGYFVKAGSRDETLEVSGVSHFLEHMVFKGTSNRSAEDVNRELDDMGSSSNARTSEESTIYHAAVLPEFQTPMIELMSDLMRPSLREEDFITEKQVIIEEIKMYEDQPPYGGHEKLMADFFGKHPLGQSVLGTVQTVTDLTSNRMRDYFQSRYSPSNIALAVAGDIDFEKLIEDVERICGHWNSYEATRNGNQAEYESGFEMIHKPNSSLQYIMQLAPGPATETPARYAARVATAIMGDDSGSRMYWKFLDSGLAESAGMGGYEYQGSGLVMSYVCCAPENAQSNIDRLQELQTKVFEEGVTQRELDLAKRKIASHIVLAGERTESRMFSLGSQWLSGQPYKTISEVAEIYESLTLDQINASIKDYPLMENMTLVVGPCEGLKPAG